MLHHVSIGVRDLERAANFYDVVLGTLGYHRVMEVLPVAVAYGINEPTFWVQLPHNQQIATAGNGTHISFIARSQEAVDAFYEAALKLGAQNAGEPGPRPDYAPDYYGAFIYDPDGNKLEATLLPLPVVKPVRKPAKKVVKQAAAKKAVKKVKKKAARVIRVIEVPKPAKAKPAKAKPAKGKPDKDKPSKDKKDKAGKKDKKDKKGKKNKKAKS